MTDGLQGLVEWRAKTDAHLVRLDRVSEAHEQDLRAKRGADNLTLSAIRETQLDHGRKLDVIESKVDDLNRGQKRLDRAVESLQGDMGMVKGRLGKVEDKLGKVEDKLGRVEAGIKIIQDKLDLLIGSSPRPVGGDN
jgi:chromosome segregation ATPase